MKRTSLALLALGLIALAGCGKVTRENYDRVNTGMSVAEVEGILGRGTTQAGGGAAIGDFEASGQVLRWGSEKKHIQVTFLNGKAIAKVQSGL